MLCKHCDRVVDGGPMLLAIHLKADHGLTVGPGLAVRDHTRSTDDPIVEA